MKKYFTNLFEYNDWANNAVITTIKNMNCEDEKILKTMNHIIAAQDLWLERINNLDNHMIELWEVLSANELVILSKISSSNWLKFIKKLRKDKFNDPCEYVNIKGKEFVNIYSDIMQHVINHSSYHRGQINSLLRSLGHEPVIIDYIHYKRKEQN